MIAQLSGKLIHKTPTASVVDCNGVGYEVFHTPFTAEKMGTGAVVLFIHTNVREDAFQLFGFATAEERSIFRELLKVSSVGPKLAISILSGIEASDLIRALHQKDASRLQKIPGIGKKTAERLVVELSDRLDKLSTDISLPSGASASAVGSSKETEIESVLLHLGYQRGEIQRAIKSLKVNPELEFSSQSLEALVKLSLRELSQARSV